MTDRYQRPEARPFDVKSWGFRKSYPNGIKLTGELSLQCKKCNKQYGREGSKKPKVLDDGMFDYCPNMVKGQRCMSREYEVYRKIELEAMPIGRVQLPSGRQGSWTARDK